jgi:hypothetical protein
VEPWIWDGARSWRRVGLFAVAVSVVCAVVWVNQYRRTKVYECWRRQWCVETLRVLQEAKDAWFAANTNDGTHCVSMTELVHDGYLKCVEGCPSRKEIVSAEDSYYLGRASERVRCLIQPHTHVIPPVTAADTAQGE